VEATLLLSQSVISDKDLKKIDQHLVDFADAFTVLFGSERVTPNMHFMFHLTSDIRRYGPCFVYHCFGFERFNGIVGKIPSDNRAPEKTFMRRIRQLQHFRSLAENEDFEFTDKQRTFWKACCSRSEEAVIMSAQAIKHWELYCTCKQVALGCEQSPPIVLLNKEPVCYISWSVRTVLETLLQNLYPNKPASVPMQMQKFKRVRIGSLTLNTRLWNSGRGAVLAKLSRTVNKKQVTRLWPGYISYVFQVDVVLSESIHNLNDASKPFEVQETITHRFAKCEWYELEEDHENMFKSTWKASTIEDDPYSIIPIQRIAAECVMGEVTTGCAYRILVIPNQRTAWIR
jgi:hypothetical protein